MSSNNVRRHRQLLKKRVLNVNDIINKRSPPPDRIGNPPSDVDDPFAEPNQGIPPIGPNQPTSDPTGPQTGPPGGHSPPVVPPPKTSSPSPTLPHPTQPVPPTHTSDSAPQVPVNTLTSLTSSIPSSTASSTTSTSLSTSSALVTPTVATPTQQAPTVTYVTPSVDSNTFSNTISVPSPSVTDSDGGDSSLSTGSIVGIVAASLVAVAAVIVVGMWLAKRYFKNRDEAEFNRDSFIRQSVHIPDDDDFRSPRPPTMIERHKGAYSPQPHGGMYPIPPMPTIQPGEMMANVANPFAGGPQYGMHPSQQPSLVRVPSNGSAHSYGSPMGVDEYYSPTQAHGYADLQRSSVTPYQAAQYAEISRQLNISSVANSPISPAFVPGQFGQRSPVGQNDDLGRLPTPSPQNVTSPGRVMSPTVPVGGYSFPMPLNQGGTSQSPASDARAAAMAALGVAKPASMTQAPAVEGHDVQNNRPATVYGEEDAYDGM